MELDAPPGISDITAEKPPVYSIHVSNFGKSVASKVRVITSVEPVPAHQAPTFVHQQGQNGTIAQIFPAHGSGIFQVRFAKGYQFSQAGVNDLAAGESYIVVFGTIAYEDTYGKHWTRFCRWNAFGPTNTYAARSCTAYDAVGEGDPPEN